MFSFEFLFSSSRSLIFLSPSTFLKTTTHRDGREALVRDGDGGLGLQVPVVVRESGGRHIEVGERKEGKQNQKKLQSFKKKTHRCACDGIDIFTPFKTCGAAANAASGSPKTRLVGPMSPVTS